MSDEKEPKKIPLWFPLRVGDFLADTMHMTCEELGAYVRILCATWRTDDCTITNDEKVLRRTTRIHPARWKRVWGEIKSMFEAFPVGGKKLITSRPLWVDRQEADRKLTLAEESGRLGGIARAKNNKPTGIHGRTMTRGHDDTMNAPKPLKNNNAGLANAIPNTTQHNTTDTDTEKRRGASPPAPSESYLVDLKKVEEGLQGEQAGRARTKPKPLPEGPTEGEIQEKVSAYCHGRWGDITGEIFEAGMVAETKKPGAGRAVIDAAIAANRKG
jgi:hypothetical protein